MMTRLHRSPVLDGLRKGAVVTHGSIIPPEGYPPEFEIETSRPSGFAVGCRHERHTPHANDRHRRRPGRPGAEPALTLAGRDHLVLERRTTLGGGWQDRWDGFRLVTPNWMASLPGQPYDGADPDGFMPRDEIVGRVAEYAERVQAPVMTGTAVDRLTRDAERWLQARDQRRPDAGRRGRGGHRQLPSAARPRHRGAARDQHPSAPFTRVPQRELPPARRRTRRRVGTGRRAAGRRAAGRRPTRLPRGREQRMGAEAIPRPRHLRLARHPRGRRRDPRCADAHNEYLARSAPAPCGDTTAHRPPRRPGHQPAHAGGARRARAHGSPQVDRRAPDLGRS